MREKSALQILFTNRDNLVKALNFVDESSAEELKSIAKCISEAISNGGKVLWCGNGGSAAESQHMSAELIGRFMKLRKPLPSVSLTTDTSAITAIGNDFSFNEIFERQVEGIGIKGDCLIGFSTSGNSENVYKAFSKARNLGIKTIGFVGFEKGKIGEVSNFILRVNSTETARIQEVHTLLGHTLCQLIEADFS